MKRPLTLPSPPLGERVTSRRARGVGFMAPVRVRSWRLKLLVKSRDSVEGLRSRRPSFWPPRLESPRPSTSRGGEQKSAGFWPAALSIEWHGIVGTLLVGLGEVGSNAARKCTSAPLTCVFSRRTGEELSDRGLRGLRGCSACLIHAHPGIPWFRKGWAWADRNVRARLDSCGLALIGGSFWVP